MHLPKCGTAASAVLHVLSSWQTAKNPTHWGDCTARPGPQLPAFGVGRAFASWHHTKHTHVHAPRPGGGKTGTGRRTAGNTSQSEALARSSHFIEQYHGSSSQTLIISKPDAYALSLLILTTTQGNKTDSFLTEEASMTG